MLLFYNITFEIPSAPSINLIFELNGYVDFTIESVKYLPKEKRYQTFSHIDFIALENKHNDYVPREMYAARYIKSGFTVKYADTISEQDILDVVSLVPSFD